MQKQNAKHKKQKTKTQNAKTKQKQKHRKWKNGCVRQTTTSSSAWKPARRLRTSGTYRGPRVGLTLCGWRPRAPLPRAQQPSPPPTGKQRRRQGRRQGQQRQRQPERVVPEERAVLYDSICMSSVWHISHATHATLHTLHYTRYTTHATRYTGYTHTTLYTLSHTHTHTWLSSDNND